jgi:hypothetical protein
MADSGRDEPCGRVDDRIGSDQNRRREENPVRESHGGRNGMIFYPHPTSQEYSLPTTRDALRPLTRSWG